MNEFKVLNGYEVKDEEARQMLNYSTSETPTGQTWIDGKPIYRKVINTGAVTSQTKTVQHNITDMDFIVSIKGIACTTSTSASTSGTFFNIPYVSTSSIGEIGACANIIVDNTTITITDNNDYLYSFVDSYVILEYTKLDTE